MGRIKKLIYSCLGIAGFYTVIVTLIIFSGLHSQPVQTPDAILILGAGISGKTAATATPNTVLKERLDTALPYIQAHPTTIVIVSGGQGTDEPTSEAQVMATYLIAHGVPEKQLILETASTRTKENIQNSKKLVDLSNVLLVTSDFHMSRAKLLAKRAGSQVVTGLSAASHATSTPYNYLREVIALGYALLFDW